jgi:hypothetical protein
MTGWLYPCLLSLFILCDGPCAPVCAQERSATDGPGFLDCGNSSDTIRACEDSWFKDCIKDWDVSTHMSREEFTQTCKRLANERVKALIDDAKRGDVLPLGLPQHQPK